MNKQDLFKNYSLNTGTLEVENWGGTVNICELSAGAINEMQTGKNSEMEMAVIAIIHGVINEEGGKMFSKGDKNKLLDMSIKDLTSVSTAIIGLSDLGDTGKMESSA